MELTEGNNLLNGGDGSEGRRRKENLWTGGTDMEGGDYDQGRGTGQRAGASLSIQQLVYYATTEPIEPPFTKTMVSEALVAWWAIMSECFGDTPPEPDDTEIAMEKLRSFLIKTDATQVARRIYKKIAAVFDLHDFMATILTLRGLRVLSRASIVAGRSYAEIGEVDSETLVQRGPDGSLQIYGLVSMSSDEPTTNSTPETA